MGWFGPNDCGCSECNFVAGWTRDSCTLSFGVGDVTDGCSLVNDLVPVITVTGPVTIPPVVSYDFFGRTHYKVTIWEPAAGTYTATVQLTCSDSTVVERTYVFEFTGSTPNCFCCPTRVPDYLTISGLGGVGAYANGTYSLVNPSLGDCSIPANMPCIAGIGIISWCGYCPPAQPAFEPEPSGNKCDAANPALLGTYFLGSDQFFVYEGGVQIHVATATSTSPGATATREVIVYIKYLYRAYRLRGSTCGVSPNEVSQTWVFTSSCDDGGLSLLCEVDNYSFVVPSLGTPTPNLFFVP